jgi:hypothetical protein
MGLYTRLFKITIGSDLRAFSPLLGVNSRILALVPLACSHARKSCKTSSKQRFLTAAFDDRGLARSEINIVLW